MKTNQQQKLWLQEYLRAVLKYRETYEEVYDHILLALEKRPEQQFFESTVNAIITDDFGGSNGLFMMEENCRNAVVNEVRQHYRRIFFSYLKFPFIIYTTVISVMVCYIAAHVSFKVIILPASIWALSAIMIPILLTGGRGFKIGYKLGDAKKSLKDDVLEALAYRPRNFVRLLILWGLLKQISESIMHDKIVFDLWKYIDPVILLIILLGLTIHALSFIRLIRSEFKMNSTIAEP